MGHNPELPTYYGFSYANPRPISPIINDLSDIFASTIVKALINWFTGARTVGRFKEKEQSSASARKKRKKGG